MKSLTQITDYHTFKKASNLNMILYDAYASIFFTRFDIERIKKKELCI